MCEHGMYVRQPWWWTYGGLMESQPLPYARRMLQEFVQVVLKHQRLRPRKRKEIAALLRKAADEIERATP